MADEVLNTRTLIVIRAIGMDDDAAHRLHLAVKGVAADFEKVKVNFTTGDAELVGPTVVPPPLRRPVGG